jgi:hypothetical protein
MMSNYVIAVYVSFWSSHVHGSYSVCLPKSGVTAIIGSTTMVILLVRGHLVVANYDDSRVMLVCVDEDKAGEREMCPWAISILFWWLDAQDTRWELTKCWAKVYLDGSSMKVSSRHLVICFLC